MAQTFNTILSFVKSTSRKDRRKGVGSLSVSAVAGGGVGSVADSATQAWVRDNFVDKTTEQEISALKTFSQGIKIGDVSLFKHPDGYVYLDETLVLKGGVVMYGNSSGVDVPSIFDSLPIDGRTIKRDGNGALYVDETALSISGGGSGGGVADSVHWNNVTGKPSWIGSTKPTYKYSEIEERPDLSVYAKLSDIPSLNGYATQSWVEGKGYLLASTASNTYQPKITSSNKLAYSLISGTPTIPTMLSQLTDDVVAGNYLSMKGGTINGSLTATSFIGNLTGNADSATTMSSFAAASDDTTKRYIWMSWTDNSGKPAYSDKLRFQASTNTLFSTNFAGNLTGTADNANSLGGESYLSFARYTAGNGYIGFYIPNTSIHNLGQGDGYIEYYDGDWYNAKWGKVTALNGFIGNLTGNADSATKLATARTIWGQSFDGTGNITGDIAFGDDKKISWHNQPSYYYINSPTTSDGAYLQYMAYSGHRFLGGNVAIGDTHAYAKLHVHGDAIIQTLHFITNEINGVNGTGNAHINYSSTGKVTIANGGGNVAIGGTAADAKLHVHGTAKFTGDTTFSSKKIVIGTIPVYESADGTLFVDANVVFRGGVAMYGDTTTTVNEE